MNLEALENRRLKLAIQMIWKKKKMAFLYGLHIFLKEVLLEIGNHCEEKSY